MEKWKQSRKHPYTDIGVRRLKCIRCGKPARFQWQICADKNNYRPLCVACDVALNSIVLRWMRHPEATKLVEVYARELK